MQAPRREPLPVLSPAGAWALFLDIDGTLAEIVPDPSLATIPRVRRDALATLYRGLGGALAILTGRTAEAADRLLAPVRLPLASVHGAYLRLTPDSPTESRARPISENVRTSVEAICRSFPGTWAEEKGNAIAVHYRAVPSVAAPLLTGLQQVLDTESRLAIFKGRMVFEIHDAKRTKADALACFMSARPFAGRRPVMIGDDGMDQSALDLANHMGGFGLSVGGEYFAADAADFACVEAVGAWIETQALTLSAPAHS